MIIVIATEHELKLIDEDMKQWARRIVITGVGGTNIVRALRDEPKDEKVINIGYAGSNSIEIGKRVNVSRVTLHHPGVEYNEPSFILETHGDQYIAPCYTSNDFVTQTNIEKPAVFDMELAFIAALGFQNIEAYKIVSDNLDLKQYETTAEGE